MVTMRSFSNQVFYPIRYLPDLVGVPIRMDAFFMLSLCFMYAVCMLSVQRNRR